MKWKAMGVGLLLSGLGMSGFSVIPVVDWTSIYHQLEELEALHKEVKLVTDQLGVAQDQLAALSGENLLGKWKNLPEDLEAAEWSPSSWAGVLDDSASQWSSHYEDLRSAYGELHPGLGTAAVEHFSDGAGQSVTQIFQENIQHNQASQALASGAYDEVNQDLDRLQALGAKIGTESDDPDLKHAVDLNSRLLLTLGNISVQSLRMMSLLNQQWAQSQATVLEQEQDASAYLAKDRISTT